MAHALDRGRRTLFGLDGTLSLLMTATALGPVILLLTAGAPLFTRGGRASTISFEYWSLLVVVLVLGTALLMARIFAAVLSRYTRPIVEAASELAGTGNRDDAGSPLDQDIGTLAAKFEQIEAVLSEGRDAALSRIRALEAENARLEEAAQVQARFLSEISHELRTPLSAIVSSARIIRRYHEQDKTVVDRFGATIVTEGNRLVRLVADMVDLAKIETGALTWDDAEIRVATLLEDVRIATEAEAEERSLRMVFETGDDLRSAWGDRNRLEQALRGLVACVCAGVREGTTIRVRAREQSGMIRFSVAAPGLALDPATFDQACETAWKLALRGPNRAAAHGLRLALCRQIVARHCGKLWVERNGDGETVVHFTVPTVAVHLAPVLIDKHTRRQLRVLLVMKSSLLADCAIRALRLENIDARVCAKLPDVFMTAVTWTPDIVVVSPSFAWQLAQPIQDRLRKLGVPHIVMFSRQDEFVELSPQTHVEPLLAAIGRVARHGSTVLLVEDDAEYRAVIEFELTHAGYTVARVDNGADALSAIAELAPSAMVLDLAMPQLDGFAVLSELRRRELSLPVIVLTALDDSSLDGRLRELGAVDVFRKYELIESAGARDVARIREILAPVLASNPTELSREIGVVAAERTA